jgi:hypothetical protein
MNKIENTLPIGFAGSHARACERGKEKVSSIKNMKRPNVLKKYTFGRFTLSKQLPKLIFLPLLAFEKRCSWQGKNSYTAVPTTTVAIFF